MTWEENLTDDELKVIQELKKRTMDLLSPKLLADDSVFYRFCKARDFNLEKSEDMLKKHIAWRKEYDADNITDYKPPEVLTKYFPTACICFDKEGSVVTYTDIGGADAKGILNSTKKGEILKYIVRTNEIVSEHLKQQSKTLGKSVINGVFIYNHANLSLSQVTNRRAIEIAIEFAKVFQDNFPERVKYIIHINASVYFTMAFSIIKTVISSPLLQKIKFYGTDGSWKEELLRLIDAENLPAFLGGSRTDPDGDPLCRTIVIHGGKVPESYYLKKSEKSLSSLPGVETLTVSPFSKKEICLEVETAGSFLEWEFETRHRDIAFSIAFRETPSEGALELLPPQRTDTYYGPEKGLYECERSGKYAIVFDNSHSWIHSKEISYRARVRSKADVELQQVS